MSGEINFKVRASSGQLLIGEVIGREIHMPVNWSPADSCELDKMNLSGIETGSKKARPSDLARLRISLSDVGKHGTETLQSHAA
jgi:hypothetical protein